MEVYEIHTDPKYQHILSDDDTDIYKLTTRRSAETFGDITFPDYYVYSTKQKRGNFYGINNGLVFDEEAFKELGEIVALAGEVYPLEVEEVGKLNFLNVLETCNALDDDNTIWRDEDDGSKLMILEYAFLTDAFTTKSGLFRMAVNGYRRLMVVTGASDQQYDFYARYHEAGLTGLQFRKLWSDAG